MTNISVNQVITQKIHITIFIIVKILSSVSRPLMKAQNCQRVVNSVLKDQLESRLRKVEGFSSRKKSERKLLIKISHQTLAQKILIKFVLTIYNKRIFIKEPEPAGKDNLKIISKVKNIHKSNNLKKNYQNKLNIIMITFPMASASLP